MEDPKKSFFDEEPKAEDEKPTEAAPAITEDDAPDGEESEVRIPHAAGSFPPPRNNGENLATISLILSLASIFCCGVPASIAAIITAIMSRRALGRFTGTAIAGLVIGIGSMILTIVVVVLLSIIMTVVEQIIAQSGGVTLFLPFLG